ncbi:hypothetical protein OC842_005792 [Tilletia horrida]|uniref:Uncharacterized protein n=1 Tax=Tilletia horrida TaxID=155126 RepID=A0AAN6GBL3_9BASI|nr:hypothetical protein OC842_005792 [Tilletia horrida]
MLEAVDCRFLFDLTISDTVSIVLMNGEQSRVPIFMLSCNIINHVTDYLQRHLSALPGHDFRLIYGSVDSSRSSTFSGGSESEAHRFESFEEMSAQLAFAITFSTLLAVIRTGNHTLCPPYGPRTGHSEIMKIEQSLCTGLRSEVAMPLLALAHAAAREQVEDRHLEDALYALTDRQCPWLWGAHDFLPLSVVLFSYNSANAQWPSYCDYHDAFTRLWDALRDA